MRQLYRDKLHEDKDRISKQIGILENEIPRLILDRKVMRSLVRGRITDSKRLGGWGQCFYANRTVFVDCSKTLEWKKDRHGNYIRKISEYDSKSNAFRSRRVKQKRTYRSYLKVLIHELVHYRFAYMQHGKKYEQRINEILGGRTFEPKHVHLFSHMYKEYRRDLDLA
jgi:hypothetical protein